MMHPYAKYAIAAATAAGAYLLAPMVVPAAVLGVALPSWLVSGAAILGGGYLGLNPLSSFLEKTFFSKVKTPASTPDQSHSSSHDSDDAQNSDDLKARLSQALSSSPAPSANDESDHSVHVESEEEAEVAPAVLHAAPVALADDDAVAASLEAEKPRRRRKKRRS